MSDLHVHSTARGITLESPLAALNDRFRLAALLPTTKANLEPLLLAPASPRPRPADIDALLRYAGPPEEYPAHVVALLFGAAVEHTHLILAPASPPDWTRMALLRARFGRTLLDVEVRRRSERATVKVWKRFGPPRTLRLRWGGADAVTAVTLDETPLGTGPAAFIVEHTHEIVFYF